MYCGAAGWARMLSCATRPDSRSDLEGFCGEADRVVVVRPTSPVSGPAGRKRCPASVGSAGVGRGGVAVWACGPRLPAIKAALGTGTATIGLLLAGVTVGAILGLLASTPVLHWLGTPRALPGGLP